MESTRRNFRCLPVIIGFAIAVFALAAQGQTLNATLTSKVFNPVAIPVGGQSSLTVSMTNSTGAQMDGVMFISRTKDRIVMSQRKEAHSVRIPGSIGCEFSHSAPSFHTC